MALLHRIIIHFFYYLFVVHFFVVIVSLFLYRAFKKILGIYKGPIDYTIQDVFRTIPQILERCNATITEHTFTTADNYKILAWRISSKTPIEKSHQCPVLLMHGFIDCGATWFFQENTEQTLPILLLKQGYDVWVGHNRGTKFGKDGCDAPGYWDYTFDQLAQYDVPAFIDGILKVSGAEKMAYVGHSQGCTQFLAALTEHSELAPKIAVFIGIGPIISLGHHSKDSMLEIFKRYPVVQLLKFLGFNVILHLPSWLVQMIAVLTCNIDFYFNVQINAIGFTCGFPTQHNITKTRLAAILAHQPGGTSVNSCLQWLQVSRKDKFTKLDYGSPAKNRLVYGSDSPPVYDFSKLRHTHFKKYLFRGTRDCLIDEKDFMHLIRQFNDESVVACHIDDFAHLDYLWASNAYEKLYKRIDKIMLKQHV